MYQGTDFQNVSGGARIDRFNGGGNALQMLCGMLAHDGEMYQGRSRFKAIEFMLSVGADPNAKPDAEKGDEGTEMGKFVTMTPLHQALFIRDSDLCKRLMELLLQYKADVTAKHDGKTVLNTAPSKGLQMTLKALVNRYQNAARPLRHCPCGSARPYESCHGAKNGVPLHPRAMCLCQNAEKKTYGSCCLPAGKLLFEKIPQRPPLITSGTRGVAQPRVPTAIDQDGAQAIMDEHMNEYKMQFMRSMIGPLVTSRQCDPAYAYAAVRSAFMVARPWRNEGTNVMPRAEMDRRQKVWNALVDEYIEGAKDDEPLQIDGRENREDLRSRAEIEVAAKISWTGGPLYTTCCNPGCRKVESTPYEFALCSKCKQSRFCSKECLQAAWKTHHKPICGTNDAEPRLASEEVVSDTVCRNLLHDGGGPGGPGPPGMTPGITSRK
jgi:hypothetical protein